MQPNFRYSAAQVREHSFAAERCGPHVVTSPATLRSSDFRYSAAQEEYSGTVGNYDRR